MTKLLEGKVKRKSWGWIVLGLLPLLVGWLPPVAGNEQDRGQRVQTVPGTGQRLALVIGNADYTKAPLRNPVNDATDMARVLKTLGFDVTLATDARQSEMKRLIRDFGARLRAGGVGLFFFAGHGMQVSGRNYLIPVGADIQDEADVEDQAVDVNLLLDKMDVAGNGLNIVILDACRNNPFRRGFSRDQGSEGLAQISAPNGTLLAYATAPGKVASDGNGRNGLYTSELMKQLMKPGLRLEDVFIQTRIQVKQQSAGRQVPWENGALEGVFYFSNRETTTQTELLPSASLSADRETSFWNSIQNSTEVADFQEYLKKYPNGEFAGLARNRISKLENASKPNSGNGISGTRPPVVPAPAKQMTNRLGMEFVLIPEGSFEMGSNKGEANEKPVHRVTITKPYYLGKYEVTQGQWEAVMESNPSKFKGANLPVENVSWEDCQEFIKKLNAKGEGEYRLPTEAEWEYACRAGTTGDYARSLDAMGWYVKNSGKANHQVGQKSPNAWGLYDMHGNVWEWCQDWYDREYYGKSSGNDPTGPSVGTRRVIRGGGWNAPAGYCRSADRYWNTPDNRNNVLGFRLVRTVR